MDIHSLAFNTQLSEFTYFRKVLPPTLELLDYFREKVAEFEALEEDYIARLESLNEAAPGTVS